MNSSKQVYRVRQRDFFGPLISQEIEEVVMAKYWKKWEYASVHDACQFFVACESCHSKSIKQSEKSYTYIP